MLLHGSSLIGKKVVVPVQDHDYVWMKCAIQQAEQAAQVNEVPVGAVIVVGGECVAKAHNNPISTNNATGHAELNAIVQACRFVENYRLPDADLYVTLEPCTMCLGAIIHARLNRVIFATSEPRAGALISQAALCLEPYNHSIQYTTPVLQDESAALLKLFFQRRRSC